MAPAVLTFDAGNIAVYAIGLALGALTYYVRSSIAIAGYKRGKGLDSRIEHLSDRWMDTIDQLRVAINALTVSMSASEERMAQCIRDVDRHDQRLLHLERAAK